MANSSGIAFLLLWFSQWYPDLEGGVSNGGGNNRTSSVPFQRNFLYFTSKSLYFRVPSPSRSSSRICTQGSLPWILSKRCPSSLSSRPAGIDSFLNSSH